ncbi:MAG TPA: hypothetical protein VLL25_06115 [Acidimicrobiales bacterium]|nr:hypothetical protein [Acidimicrobiales bacterium]
MPTLDQIDQTLGRLSQASERMTANLFELENDPNRKLLDQASLAGVTAERWREASKSLAQLWQWFTQFKQLVDQATQLRGPRPRVDATRLAQLDQLVNGPSIELSTEQIPLAQRGLFGAAEATVRCTPDELLARMSDTFDHVKAVVAATSEAWGVLLPRLQAVETDLAAADKLAASLDERHVPELDRVRAQLDDISSRLATDPLSIQPGATDTLVTGLTAARQDLEELARLRDNVATRLDQGRGLLAELERTVREAREAHDEATLKIAAPDLPKAPVLDPSFGRHLDRVTALAARSEWRAARHELSEWTATANALLANANRVATVSRVPIAQRNELRGRLDAYRAKANRMGVLEDSRLSALYERAHEALYTAPTDLTAANDLIHQYQQSLPINHTPREVSS